MKTRHLQILLLAAACAGGAQAQKLSPGLWEHTFTMKMQGGEMEEGMKRMQEQLARMPPEKRKQMEAMLASQGGGVGGQGMAAGLSMMSGKPTTVKLCLTPEQAARDEIPQSQGNCQQLSQQRSGKTVKFKFSCTGESSATGEGEYTLLSDKAHTGHMVVDTTSRNGKAGRMELDQSAKWLAADCGDVKPRPAVKR